MMEQAIQKKLEAFFHKKILLYRSLLDCLKKERDHLVSLDLNGLWDVSKVKDDLCARITSVRQQISSVARAGDAPEPSSTSDLIDALPEEGREGLRRLSGKVGLLKNEVEAYRKENVAFINESLAFIDELIMNLSGGAPAQNVYDNRCRLKKTGSRMLLMREV